MKEKEKRVDKNLNKNCDVIFEQDSEDLPSRDDVSHRAVFGDDIDEEELLEEIESEEKIEEDDEEVSISPTFYVQLLRTKVSSEAFLCLK